MKDVIIGPVSITLSIEGDQAYLLVQDPVTTKAEHYTQDIMPGEGPYNIRWAVEMVLRRYVGRSFDRWVLIHPPKKEKKGVEISLDDSPGEDIIE